MKVFISGPIPTNACDYLTEKGIEWDYHDSSIPLNKQELIEKAQDAHGLITTINDCIDQEVIQALSHLKCISQMAVGVDNINIQFASSLNIPVGHTPHVLTDATADLTMALILAVVRKLPQGQSQVRRGTWGAWEPQGLLGRDLGCLRLGIVGMGAIAAKVARRAYHGFSMAVHYHSPRRRPEVEKYCQAKYHQSLTELARHSDILSLHCSLNEQTQGLINHSVLGLLPHGSYVINTSRGDVLNQDDLLVLLQNGHLAGAALDVTSPEPLSPEHPLLQLPECLITPHIGSATKEARQEMALLAAENCVLGLENKPLKYQVNIS